MYVPVPSSYIVSCQQHFPMLFFFPVLLLLQFLCQTLLRCPRGGSRPAFALSKALPAKIDR
jgi:hypothetical protein